MYFDKNGNEISREDWSSLYEDINYKRVDWYEWEGGYISTIWLGLDYSTEEGDPIIFETLVQTEDDEYMVRYQTVEEAVAGHKRLLILAGGVRWVLAPQGWLALHSGEFHFEERFGPASF